MFIKGSLHKNQREKKRIGREISNSFNKILNRNRILNFRIQNNLFKYTHFLHVLDVLCGKNFVLTFFISTF